MRGKLRALVLVAAGLRASTMLAGDAFDGRTMGKACDEYVAGLDTASPAKPPGSYASGTCAGFVGGAIAAHALDVAVARARSGSASSRICVPEKASLTDEVRVFCTFLKAHPSNLDEPGVELLYAALLEAWPCPERPAR